MRAALIVALGSALCGPLAAGTVPNAMGTVPIKVVVVTTYEDDYNNPNATGLSKGEAKLWIEGLHLDKVLPLEAGFRPVRMNDQGVLELMTGMTTARAAVSTMALGLDRRFDLTHAYWLLAGIAGIDPEQASLGSAAWAHWVVDLDIANAIDPREIPPGWPDGQIPWDRTSPLDPPAADIGEVHELNPHLVRWAYELTKNVPIPDSDGMREFRSRFTGYPRAQRPPFVLIGDNLASATYWQGTLDTLRARRWVRLFTGGRGTFTTTSCEDAGFLEAMTFLAKAGRVDLRRVLILRTASDYCLPRPGVTAAGSLAYGSDKAYMADREAFESAYLVGSAVVNEWVRGWPAYRDRVP